MKTFRHRRPHRGPRGQRGVVLFIALIVMVALTLAGVTLMRSVDTTTAAAGNLAFRQGSIAPANLAVEQAVKALREAATINPTTDKPDENYYAVLQDCPIANDKCVSGIPVVLQAKYAAGDYGGFKVLTTKDLAGETHHEVRYVIERMCLPGAEGQQALPKWCDMSPPKQAPATTAMELNKIALGRVPFYRLSVRVDGPGNTVTYAQAMLR